MEIKAYNEALRLRREFSWSILPVPHGWTEPRFDWTAYRAKLPDIKDLEAWLRPDVGCGVVCGKVSGNLVALEFLGRKYYDLWLAENHHITNEHPAIQDDGRVVVLARTHETLRSGSLYIEGMKERVGQLISDGRIVVLPPTRQVDNTWRTWIVPVNDRLGDHVELKPDFDGDYCPVFKRTLRDLGLYTKTFPVPPKKRAATQTGRQVEAWDEAAIHPHELDNLFVAAPEYMGPTEENDLFWIVEGLLPETYLTVVAGTTKCGKSCLLTALAMAVATGEPFLGLPTTQAPVLWVAYEESREERALALRPFGKTPENLYISHTRIPIDTDKGIAMLRHWIRETGARLIVIDPLYAATSVESLSDGRSARDALSGLKELCRVEKCAAVVLHHLTKSTHLGLSRERFADSHQILAVASMDLLMDVEDLSGCARRIWLHGRGRGDFANQTWLIHSRSATEYDLVAKGAQPQVSQFAGDEVILDAMRAAEKPLTSDEISATTGLNINTLRNRLTEMTKDGRVKTAGKSGRAILYEALAA